MASNSSPSTPVPLSKKVVREVLAEVMYPYELADSREYSLEHVSCLLDQIMGRFMTDEETWNERADEGLNPGIILTQFCTGEMALLGAWIKTKDGHDYRLTNVGFNIAPRHVELVGEALKCCPYNHGTLNQKEGHDEDTIEPGLPLLSEHRRDHLCDVRARWAELCAEQTDRMAEQVASEILEQKASDDEEVARPVGGYAS